ncbi:MAG: TonB-dependent receptor [Exilibacterium sp.]
MLNKNKLAAAVLAAISSGAMGEASTKQDSPMIEEVSVVGIRKSLQAASDLKRNSSVIQDSIVVEDIGKFPDQNVAESLQRISGVSIDRDRGEGSKITVRGFGPAFNVVKLNGRTLATTSRGRDFDFQVLASELISGADVIKSPMGKTPAGSIGAYINIKTTRPLDDPGLKIAGSIKGKRNELSGDNSPQYSGIFSNTFADDTIGVLVGFSKQESSNRIDSTSTGNWAIMTDPALDITGDIVNTRGEVVTPSQLRYAGRHQFGIGQEERERTAANLTLQWAPSETFTHTLDFIYSDFGNIALGQGMQIPLQRNGWRNVVVSDNNTILAAEKFQTEDSTRGHPMDGHFSVSGSESETQAIGFNSRADFGQLRLNLDVSVSEAEAMVSSHSMVPNYINGDNGKNEFTYNTLNGGILDFSTTIDLADPANARAHWNSVGDTLLKDEITELKFDAGYDLEMGALVSIDAGIAYADRTKSSDHFVAPDGCKNKNVSWSDPDIDLYNTCGTFRDIPDSVFQASPVKDFLSDEKGNFPRDFILVSDIDTYHAALQKLRGDTWPQMELVENASVETTEQTATLYTQFNFEGLLGAYEWRGNLGLRYVETDTASTGHRKDRLSIVAQPPNEGGENLLEVTYTENRPVTIEQSYSNLLPSANVSIDFLNGFVARAAASKVMSRPKIEDIGVNRSYSASHQENFSSGGGNPYLKPYEAKQYDLSLEYYQDNGNAYAVNVFRKDISNFISTLVTQDSTPDVFVDGKYVDTVVEKTNGGILIERIRQKENRPGGSITGVEIAALHHFDYLPGIFNGLGIQANYTRLTSEDDAAEALNEENVREPGSAIEGFAEDSYNIIGFYDKNGIQLRAAYNWRGNYLSRRLDDGLPRHVDAYGQLDLRASYDITDKITVSASAVNVTNEKVFHYADVKERMRLIQYTGPRYLIGINAKF